MGVSICFLKKLKEPRTNQINANIESKEEERTPNIYKKINSGRFSQILAALLNFHRLKLQFPRLILFGNKEKVHDAELFDQERFKTAT